MAGQNAVHRMPTWGTSYGKNRIQNVEQFSVLTSDLLLRSCLKQLTILALTTFYIHPPSFFLTCHCLLIFKNPTSAVKLIWINSICQAQGPKNFALYSLILTFRQDILRSARDFAHRKAKIHKLHQSYLYQMSNSLVKGNLSIRAIHIFFNAIKQNLKLEQKGSRSNSGDPLMAGPERINLP